MGIKLHEGLKILYQNKNHYFNADELLNDLKNIFANLSRNNIFSQLMLIYFSNFNKKIIAIKDSNESLVRDLLSVLGQEEINRMKGRVRDVRLNQFEKGIIVGRCPVGYLPIFKNKRDRRGIIGIKPDPKKMGMIQDVFFLTSEGKSYKEICSISVSNMRCWKCGYFSCVEKGV